MTLFRYSCNWIYFMAFSWFLFFAACNLQVKPTSLNEAAANGNLQYVKKFVESNVDIDQRDNNGYSPLMNAVYYNSHDTAAYLLQKGADINLQGKDGRTAIIIATCNMNTRMIKTLLAYHPNLSITDDSGYKALDHAKNLNLTSISNLLTKSIPDE